MLLHVVIHLLLLVGSILVILEFVIFVFVKITLTFLINLSCNIQIFVFKHEVLFVSIMFIKFSLLFWGQLLSKMMPPSLRQRYDPSLLLSCPLPYLRRSPRLCLHLLPILYLNPLALLIEVVVQQ
jgi:hypothetical protein